MRISADFRSVTFFSLVRFVCLIKREQKIQPVSNNNDRIYLVKTLWLIGIFGFSCISLKMNSTFRSIFNFFLQIFFLCSMHTFRIVKFSYGSSIFFLCFLLRMSMLIVKKDLCNLKYSYVQALLFIHFFLSLFPQYISTSHCTLAGANESLFSLHFLWNYDFGISTCRR